MALPGDFDFAVRYIKGEEKVCVLDRNPWLTKMRIDTLRSLRPWVLTLFDLIMRRISP